jgi:hypothetical protein
MGLVLAECSLTAPLFLGHHRVVLGMAADSDVEESVCRFRMEIVFMFEIFCEKSIFFLPQLLFL